MAGDGDDVVYASILARVEQSDLHNQLQKVVRKEYKSINRQVRHASSSLTALRQLQAVSEHLRPSGDWLPKTLQAQLKSIEELQSRIEIALDVLETDASDRRTKKRKRPLSKGTVKPEDEDNEVVVLDVRGSFQRKGNRGKLEVTEEVEVTARKQDEESDVDRLEIVDLAKRRADAAMEGTAVHQALKSREKALTSGQTIELRGEKPMQMQQEKEDSDVEIIEVVAVGQRRAEVVMDNMKEQSDSQVESGEGDVDLTSETDELPCGLVRITRDAAVRIKEELMPLPDNQVYNISSQAGIEAGSQDTIESPIELEVLESSDSEHSAMETSDTEELAMELDVPDSDSEDDFSACMELAAWLQDVSTVNQLVKFPVAVEQLRSYLVHRKHMTVAELDGYLFAHKRITNEEANEIGRALETIICVGMALPLRAKIRQVLSDLLAIIEQLECTLGELPVFLRPVVMRFSSYVLFKVDKNLDRANRKPL